MTKAILERNRFVGPTFAWTHRAYRVLWWLTCALAFRPSPRPFHSWRRALLRLFGAEVAAGCHVYPRAKIWAPFNLEMGEDSCLADDVSCYCVDKIRIGRRVVVSQGAHLCTGSHDISSPFFALVTAPITICDHVWVASEAFIGPGVHLGEGCVVGARGVVTKNTLPWTVYTGNPAKPIKLRSIRQSETAQSMPHGNLIQS